MMEVNGYKNASLYKMENYNYSNFIHPFYYSKDDIMALCDIISKTGVLNISGENELNLIEEPDYADITIEDFMEEPCIT